MVRESGILASPLCCAVLIIPMISFSGLIARDHLTTGSMSRETSKDSRVLWKRRSEWEKGRQHDIPANYTLKAQRVSLANTRLNHK